MTKMFYPFSSLVSLVSYFVHFNLFEKKERKMRTFVYCMHLPVTVNSLFVLQHITWRIKHIRILM